MAGDGKTLVFQESLGCFTIRRIGYPSMSGAAGLPHTYAHTFVERKYGSLIVEPVCAIPLSLVLLF